jgi:hypothetical protein
VKPRARAQLAKIAFDEAVREADQVWVLPPLSLSLSPTSHAATGRRTRRTSITTGPIQRLFCSCCAIMCAACPTPRVISPRSGGAVDFRPERRRRTAKRPDTMNSYCAKRETWRGRAATGPYESDTLRGGHDCSTQPCADLKRQPGRQAVPPHTSDALTRLAPMTTFSTACVHQCGLMTTLWRS